MARNVIVALMMETWHAWWETPVLLPQVQELTAPRPRSPGTALCFSGGLDSFYSLQELLQADLAGPLHDAIRALLQRSTQQPPRHPPARRWAWLNWIGLRGGDRSN